MSDFLLVLVDLSVRWIFVVPLVLPFFWVQFFWVPVGGLDDDVDGIFRWSFEGVVPSDACEVSFGSGFLLLRVESVQSDDALWAFAGDSVDVVKSAG